MTREEEIQKAKDEAFPIPDGGREYGCACGAAGFELGVHWADNHPINNDRLRYCIEYINPQYPFLDNGELNIRHLRISDEHNAEMALTLMLSFGAKIVSIYRGNVIEGRIADWTPLPDIVEDEDWISEEWINKLKAEALKDLPRWEKSNLIDTVNLSFKRIDGKAVICYHNRMIALADLKKLPGFKEK